MMSYSIHLPDGWRRVTLDDVVVRASRRYEPDPLIEERWIGADHLDEDDLTVRRWGITTDPLFPPTFRFKFVAGAVLIHSRNPKKVAVADFGAVTGEKIFALVPRDGAILDARFFAYMLQSHHFREFTSKWLSGSVNKFLNWTALARYVFALPPIEEQRRIVEVASSADDAAGSYRDANRSASLLLAAETSSLVDTASESNVPLSDVADAIYGLTMNSRRGELELSLPYLRVANIQRGQIDMSEVKRVGVTQPEVEKFTLEPRDILVVEGHADASQVGRSALWITPDIGEPVLHQNHLMRIRASNKILPEFLLGVLNSSYGRKYFVSRAKSTSGLHTINSSVLRAFPVPVVNLDLQKRYVERTTALSAVSSSLFATRSSIRHLRRSLLDNLIGGQSVH